MQTATRFCPLHSGRGMWLGPHHRARGPRQPLVSTCIQCVLYRRTRGLRPRVLRTSHPNGRAWLPPAPAWPAPAARPLSTSASPSWSAPRPPSSLCGPVGGSHRYRTVQVRAAYACPQTDGVGEVPDMWTCTLRARTTPQAGRRGNALRTGTASVIQVSSTPCCPKRCLPGVTTDRCSLGGRRAMLRSRMTTGHLEWCSRACFSALGGCAPGSPTNTTSHGCTCAHNNPLTCYCTGGPR